MQAKPPPEAAAAETPTRTTDTGTVAPADTGGVTTPSDTGTTPTVPPDDGGVTTPPDTGGGGITP